MNAKMKLEGHKHTSTGSENELKITMSRCFLGFRDRGNRPISGQSTENIVYLHF
jgi:ribosomal protein S13